MNNEIEMAGLASSWNGGAGAVFKGVGDKEVESHFTFSPGQGFHASTYLSESLLGGTGNQKVKVSQDNF